MKTYLKSYILLFSLVLALVQAFPAYSNGGKSDPLSIVSEAERIIETGDSDFTPYVEDVDNDIDGMGVADGYAYMIGPSDKLRVTVYGEKDISKIYQVDGLGMISVPLVGQIKVAGMTLRQAEELLVLALSNGYIVDPSVAIEIAEFRPFYIMGEVRRPGSYNFIDGMNVLNAVAISGGFTYRANTKNIEVIRSSADGSAMVIYPTSQVMPGDIIRVKERFF